MKFLDRQNKIFGNTNSSIEKLMTRSAIVLAVTGASFTCQAGLLDATEMPQESYSLNSSFSQQSTHMQLAEAEVQAPPPGFHRMPDGKFMANSKKSKAPEGFHLMPDGTLMPHGGGDHGGHEGHGGGHHHGAGMWMFDYKFMRMDMEGFLDTTNEVSVPQLLSATGPYNYTMSPTEMTMDMHMVMGMYSFTDKFMLMIMGHYMSNEMGMLARDGNVSSMETSGMGDTIVSAMIQGPSKLTFNVGVSIPTGSVKERGLMTHNGTTIPVDTKFPYSMQLGSGTYDIKQGVSYADSISNLGWGASYEYTGHLDKNDQGYKLGDKLLMDAWVRMDISPKFNITIKMQRREIGPIDGEDPELFINMSPVMDPENYGGVRVDASVAFKFQIAKMFSITADFTDPVSQNLHGPQMETKSIASIGVGLMF